MLVPLMWCFARRLTHKRWAGAMAGALIAAGFMRFSQSRIATIDIYGTFFILLGAYFMVWYCQSVLQNGVDGSLLPMALGGVAFGLGCASKWTGIYAGQGLRYCTWVCCMPAGSKNSRASGKNSGWLLWAVWRFTSLCRS